MMLKLELLIERIIFMGRWLLAPLYLGLLSALIPVTYRFFATFWEMVVHMPKLTGHEATLYVLELIDTVFLGNLIIIVLFAGFENFVSKIKIAEESVDRPHWMGHVDYSGLKIKLIGSLVAISVIELLKDFMHDGTFDSKRETWRIAIHLTFAISGVLLSIMDSISDRTRTRNPSEPSDASEPTKE
jgi:uncharacterized protein (TIGR00645 family)